MGGRAMNARLGWEEPSFTAGPGARLALRSDAADDDPPESTALVAEH
jgi:hypothetical protein